jgi:hypothetical protein
MTNGNVNMGIPEQNERRGLAASSLVLLGEFDENYQWVAYSGLSQAAITERAISTSSDSQS